MVHSISTSVPLVREKKKQEWKEPSLSWDKNGLEFQSYKYVNLVFSDIIIVIIILYYYFALILGIKELSL